MSFLFLGENSINKYIKINKIVVVKRDRGKKRGKGNSYLARTEFLQRNLT